MTPPTMCPHNAEGQVTLAGAGTRCRMCGALLELPPGSQAGTPIAASEQVAAPPVEYPGESVQENQE